LEAVWEKQYALTEFTAPTNFKSYDELKKRLDTVLAGTTTAGTAVDVMEDEPVSSVSVDTKEVPAPKVSDDDQDTMSYFEKLAEDD